MNPQDTDMDHIEDTHIYTHTHTAYTHTVYLHQLKDLSQQHTGEAILLVQVIDVSGVKDQMMT
jgi:hypothetical protein